MTKYKKVVIITAAQVTLDRAPPAAAFLAGICEKNLVEYEVFDLNLYIKEVLGPADWANTFSVSLNMKFDCDENSELMSKINFVAQSAAEKVVQYSPDLVAVTVLSAVQIAWTRKFLEKLKEKSDVTVIAGGPGISYEQESNRSAGKILSDAGLLEYWVNGEGDFVFDKFLQGQLELGVNSSKNKFGESWVPQIDDLDSTIKPSYKKINIHAYDSPFDHTGIISIMGSRGCVRRCTFCDVGHLWKKFRFRSAENILDEILQHFKDTGTLNYAFTDSLINGSLKQFNSLMELTLKAKKEIPGFENFEFSGLFIVRPSKHHPESMFKLMKDSGCRNISIGIESGSEAVREHMGKKFSNEDIDHHLEMCSKYGIENMFLIFTGYPTETSEDHIETMRMIEKYQKYLINDTIKGISLASPMIIYKYTPIDQMRDELGIKYFHTEHDYESHNWYVESNPSLTIKERYRRYLELLKLTVELGYPRMAEDLLNLKTHVNMLIELQKKGISK